MAIFICVETDCVNKDVVYDFGDDSPAYAMCGGCQARLESQA